MSDTPSIDEILQDFADGIAAEEAWVDAKQALNQLMYNEVMSLIPEKVSTPSHLHGSDVEYINHGYNQAINDFSKAAAERFKV